MAVKETIRLPKTILMYPMTLASTAAHIVMRFQQNVAELVIKGDATLEHIFPPKEEQPEWATFDEDLPDDDDDAVDTESRGEGRVALYSSPEAGAADDWARGAHHTGQADGVCPGRSRGAGLRTADPGPVAGQAAITRCRRARSPAGLRGGHQRARAVPDAAGKQDHARDGEVTANAVSNANTPAGP